MADVLVASGHKKITISSAFIDISRGMKINVYTTHDKLTGMTEATSDRVIWRNARLATLNPDDSQPYGLRDGHALLVRNGRIEAIVPENDAPAGRSIDLGGRLLTPGLIDCHTHLVFGGSRAQEWEQRLNGVSYQTISANGGGINSTVRATRESSEAQLLALAQQRLDRLLREGVTTLEIKSGYGLDLANERKMLRWRAALRRTMRSSCRRRCSPLTPRRRNIKMPGRLHYAGV
jgi:imidazolonepropionase